MHSLPGTVLGYRLFCREPTGTRVTSVDLQKTFERKKALCQLPHATVTTFFGRALHYKSLNFIHVRALRKATSFSSYQEVYGT